MTGESPYTTDNIPIAQPLIGDEELRAASLVLASGNLTQGQEVAAFEEEFSRLAADGAHCIAVNSGTSALHLSLLALGVGYGDEVIVPSFTFAATANVVAITGATPVFADIEPDYFTIDIESVQSLVTERTRAIIPVHLYGHPAQLDALRSICDRFGLALIEDAAQAHLATSGNRLVGTIGDLGCYSFYPTKNMTSGEGGMVVTRQDDLARRVRLLRNQGQEVRYQNEIIGLNNRMTDIHAAIGRVQLGKLASWTERRQQNAQFLNLNLQNVVCPRIAEDATHVFHQYTIRVVDEPRDKIAVALSERGIGTGIYYPRPVHKLQSFALPIELPNTEKASREVLSLPVHPSLSQQALEAIVDSVNQLVCAGA